MSEIFFVFKALIVTVVIVLILQIKIGPRTVEQRSIAFLHRSVATDALRGVADGAIQAFDDGYTWTKTAFNKQFGGSGESKKSRPSRRQRREQDAVDTEGPAGDDVD